MFKRIFAVVTQKDYSNFIRRAQAEGMKVDEAFASICHAYATGANVECHAKKELKNFSVNNNADYVGYNQRKNKE